jgi:hypothetical protein
MYYIADRKYYIFRFHGGGRCFCPAVDLSSVYRRAVRCRAVDAGVLIGHGPPNQPKSVPLEAIRRHNGKDYFPLRPDIPFQRHFGKTELAMSEPSTSPSGRLRRAARSPGNSPAEIERINEDSKKYWRDARALSLQNGEFDTIGYGALVIV